MDKNIANAMLLRLNKQDQIEALKSIGFTTVNENTPASDIAKYMQWSGTLLDLSLATLRIEDGEQVFFTASEWNSMSANNRSKYIRIGSDFAPNATSSLSPKATALTQAAIKRSNGVATELTYAA